MATNIKQVPTMVVKIVDGNPQITITNWNGVSNTIVHGIEVKMERAIHQWRAKEMHKTRLAEQAQNQAA